VNWAGADGYFLAYDSSMVIRVPSCHRYDHGQAVSGTKGPR
jgi:hypothetical protein